MMIKRLFTIFLILLLTSCGTSHRIKAAKIDNAIMHGDYASATLTATGTLNADKIIEDNPDLLDTLNAGPFLFFQNDFEGASKVMDLADIKLSEHFSRSVLSKGGREATTALANASILGYEPMAMDNLYLNSYKALNYLADRNKANARIEINRGYSKQQDIAEYYDKEISKAQKAANKETQELDETNQKQASETQDKLIRENYGDLSKWKGYKNYMNPYVTYVSGLYFLLDARGRSDFETASTYLKRARGMMPKNSIIKNDLAQAEKSSNYNAKSNEKFVWVIYENGMIANFEEIRLTIPVFLVSQDVQLTTFSMPKPKLREQAFNSLSFAFGDGKKYKSEIIADMDSIFIAEFNKNLPVYLSRAIAQAVAKSMLQYAASQEEDAWASLAAQVYTLSTSSADLRSWHSLPKNVQIAKIPVKKTQNLSIFSKGTDILGEVEIKNDVNTIVYIRIPSIMSKPVISKIEL